MKQSLAIPAPVIRQYMADTNPWWSPAEGIDPETQAWPKRAYYPNFLRLVRDTEVRRAVVVIGPRRVGKTVMLMQAIQALLDDGVPGSCIFYAQLDVPLYSGESLDSLVRAFVDLHRHKPARPLWVLFDEIQYLKDWEIHLKVLVDTCKQVRFVATGSAAAALNIKSRESGAGRFSDFILPPLTFSEYLDFSGQDDLVQEDEDASGPSRYFAPNIERLNEAFINYLNYGGFPEAVMNASVRADPRRYLRQDIVDKVLQKDLPSLFGISDTQELNRFFNVLAYNTGMEVSPASLSQNCGLTQIRINEYLAYLEAAFLIKRVHRIDQNARRLQRATSFKVYLTNPSIRAALFGRVRAEDETTMGRMAETAIWSQWLHSTSTIQTLHFARWKEGRSDLEVDLVGLNPRTQSPTFAVEIKWSDASFRDWSELRGIRAVAEKYKLSRPALVTTRTQSGQVDMGGQLIDFSPSSLHCYTVARNLLR